MVTTCTELCQLAADWRGKLPETGIAVEEKKDGWRACYFRGHDGQPRLWTRNGHPIEGVEHITHRLAQFERAAGLPLFIDGEFQIGGTLEATKAWCERGWKMGGTAGVFYAFDIVPQAEWARGGWDAPWHQRKRMLTELAEVVNADDAFAWDWRPGSFGRDEGRPTVGILMDTWAFDVADVLDEARRVWAAGGEGLMLKDAEAPYRRNRHDAWQKVKRDGPWLRCL